jgi:hypothetical protein
MSTEVLEPRKGDAAEANGHGESDVPDFAAAEDFAADVAGDSTDVPEPEDAEAEAEASTSNAKIYFVRVPRPPINDELVKKLSAQFQEQVAKLKGMNAKMADKRVRKAMVIAYIRWLDIRRDRPCNWPSGH